MTEAELRRRGRLLFSALTVLALRWPSREPELVEAFRTCGYAIDRVGRSVPVAAVSYQCSRCGTVSISTSGSRVIFRFATARDARGVGRRDHRPRGVG